MDADVKKLISETVDTFLSEYGYDDVGPGSYTNRYELRAAINDFVKKYGHSPFDSPYTCKVGMPAGAPDSWEASPEDIQWFLVDRWRNRLPRAQRKEIESQLKAKEEEEQRKKQEKNRDLVPRFNSNQEDEFAPDRLSDPMSLVRENGQTEPNDQTTPSVLPPSGEEKYNKQEPGGVMSAVNIEEIQNRIASIDESSFRVYNETLCPMLWDEYKHLNPRVRVNLLRMAYDFYEKTNFQAPIKDIYLMGSAANYNWTPDSDADVHVIIDFTQLKMPIETAEKAAKVAGAAWNNEHQVWAKGHKVEINIQNSNEVKPHVTGIYSLINDQWVRMPSHQNVEVNKPLIQQKYSAMRDYIVATVQSGNYELMKQAKKYVDAFRQYGLDTAGELSVENIVFKILRSRGFIKNLKDAITATYDKEMTVREDMPWKDDNVEFESKEQEKDALVKKLLPQLNDDVLVATINKFPEMPQASYVQIDMVYDGINYFSSNPESMNRVGYKMPSTKDLLQLPTGKYKLSDVKKKLQLNEVTQSDINSRFPSHTSLYKTKAGKPIAGNFDYSKLSLSNLKSLRTKEAAAMKYLVKFENPTYIRIAQEQYRMLDAEIKRRLAYINAPVAEGYEHDPEYGAAVDFHERRDLQMCEIGHFLKSHKTNRIPWRTISASLLKKTWYKFGKYQKVDENDIDKIADQLLTNIARLEVANDFQGHSRFSIRDELKDNCDLEFTDEKWNANVWRFCDKNGLDYVSDYGIEPLSNIYPEIFNAKTPEQKLYACDKALNVVHQRNDLASMFVEGGRATLRAVADQGGYDAGYEHGQVNRDYRDSKMTAEGVGAGIPEQDRLHIPGHRWQIKSKDAPKTPKMKEELSTELEQINESIKSPHQPSENGKSIKDVLPDLIKIAKEGNLESRIGDYLISKGWTENDWAHQSIRYLSGVNSSVVNNVRNYLRDKERGNSTADGDKDVASSFQHALKARMKYDLEEQFVNGLVEQLLTESPKLDVLKKHRKTLTDDERSMVISGGAVWDDKAPGVWKSEVDGKTWYVCNTHRAYQCKPTIKGAIKAFEFIKTTS